VEVGHSDAEQGGVPYAAATLSVEPGAEPGLLRIGWPSFAEFDLLKGVLSSFPAAKDGAISVHEFSATAPWQLSQKVKGKSGATFSGTPDKEYCFAARGKFGLSATVCATAPNPLGKKLFFTPNLSLAKLVELFAQSAEWEQTLHAIHGFKYYVGAVEQLAQTYGQVEIKKQVDLLNRYQIKAAVEVGGLRDFVCLPHDPLTNLQAGKLMAAIEIPLVKPLWDAGIKELQIAMDAPFAYTLASGGGATCQFDIQTAAEQVVSYVGEVKAAFPGATVAHIEPVPLYSFQHPCGVGKTFAGMASQTPHQSGETVDCVLYDNAIPGQQPIANLALVLDALKVASDQAGIVIKAFHADQPVNYVIKPTMSGLYNGWNKTLAVQELVTSLGQTFGVLVNYDGECQDTYSAPHVGQPCVADNLFFQMSTDYLSCYENKGGEISEVVIQSWYSYPQAIVPETAASYTGFVLDVAALLNTTPFAPACAL
jgi:hypothetical protein